MVQRLPSCRGLKPGAWVSGSRLRVKGRVQGHCIRSQGDTNLSHGSCMCAWFEGKYTVCCDTEHAFSGGTNLNTVTDLGAHHCIFSFKKYPLNLAAQQSITPAAQKSRRACLGQKRPNTENATFAFSCNSRTTSLHISKNGLKISKSR